jgi:PHD/YefM family antitoxin component YafN of YafNO toxin-antitoxin module
MSTPEPLRPPFWKPLPAKTRLYESLYTLNRGFEFTLLSIERLEHLGMFPLEFLNAWKVTLERLRSHANERLMETLSQFEEEQEAYFDNLEREWQDQFKDPDDTFFEAKDRKEEIKKKIKELEKGLERQKVKKRE